MESEYIYFGIQRKLQEIEESTSFVTVKHISAKQILDIELPLPPLTEQRRIVDILNHAAGIRRLRRQALETTRRLIPALFVKMFGDPASNPKGWEVVPLGDLILNGPQNGLYKHASAYGEGVPILRIDAFYDGAVTDIRTLRRLRLTPDEVSRYGLSEDDIVINRVNSPEYLGKSAIIPALPEPTVFESNMMRFSVDTARVMPRYLIQYLQTAFIKQQILGKAKHAINQSSINQQDVKSLPVSIPPLDLQQSFALRVTDLHSLITQQERSLAQAEALMHSLMARYFGETGAGDAVSKTPSPLPLSPRVRGVKEKPLPAKEGEHDLPLVAEPPAPYAADTIPRRILSHMLPGRDYSRAEIVAALGISDTEWAGAIRQLKEEGAVVQAGERRGARYSIKAIG